MTTSMTASSSGNEKSRQNKKVPDEVWTRIKERIEWNRVKFTVAFSEIISHPESDAKKIQVDAGYKILEETLKEFAFANIEMMNAVQDTQVDGDEKHIIKVWDEFYDFINENLERARALLYETKVEDKRNPKIREYWKTIFGDAKTLIEKELVMRILKHHQKEPTAENMTIALGKIFRDCHRQYLHEDNHHYSIKEKIDVEIQPKNSYEIKLDRTLLESNDLDDNLKFWLKDVWYLELVDLEFLGIKNTPLRDDYNACVFIFNNIRTPGYPALLEHNILRIRDLFYSKCVQQNNTK